MPVCNFDSTLSTPYPFCTTTYPSLQNPVPTCLHIEFTPDDPATNQTYLTFIPTLLHSQPLQLVTPSPTTNKLIKNLNIDPNSIIGIPNPIIKPSWLQHGC